MDSFSRLPEPLLLDVLKFVPDFVTLQLLLRASPAASSVFDAYAFEVVEAVGAGCLDLELPRYPATLFAIYGALVSARTIDEFLRDHLYAPASYRHVAETYRRRRRDHAATDARTAHLVLDAAANIERLTVAVCGELIRRISAVQPMGLDDPCSLYGRDFEPRVGGPNKLHYAEPRLSWPLVSCAPPPGSPLPIPPAARQLPASWIEAFRVKRAIWLIHVLLTARRHLILSGWSQGGERGAIDHGHGEAIDFRNVFSTVFNRSAEPNVKEVAQCILHIGPDVDVAPPSSPWPWPHPRPLPAPVLLRGDDGMPLPDRFPPILLSRLPNCDPSAPTPPGFWPLQPRPDDERAALWQQSAESLHDSAYSTSRLILWGLLDFSRNREVLSHACRADLRTHMLAEWFGIRVWDLVRLHALRLAPHPNLVPDAVGVPRHPGRPGEHLLYTWWSILWPGVERSGAILGG